MEKIFEVARSAWTAASGGGGAASGDRRVPVVLRGNLRRVLPDQGIGRFLLGNLEGELGEWGFELLRDAAIGADRGGRIELTLGFYGQTLKLGQQLVVDPVPLGGQEIRRDLGHRRLRGHLGLGQQQLLAALQLAPDLGFLAGGIGEEVDPVLIEGCAGGGRRLAGRRHRLALEVGHFRGVEPERLGVRLLGEDLLPGGNKALLGAGLPNLLQNDERPHRGKGGDHDPDSDGVVAYYSQRSCQH